MPVDEPGMDELHLEWAIPVLPQRQGRVEPDVPVLVIRGLGQEFGNRRRRFERLARQLPRLIDDVVEAERCVGLHAVLTATIEEEEDTETTQDESDESARVTTHYNQSFPLPGAENSSSDVIPDVLPIAATRRPRWLHRPTGDAPCKQGPYRRAVGSA